MQGTSPPSRLQRRSVRRWGMAVLPLLALALVAFSAAPASGQEPGGLPDSAVAKLEELRPGDVIRLRIWREPDLSGDFAVQESGEVVLPKLGPLPVSGFSRDSLKRFLVRSYSEYLRNPSIEVTLLRRVNVLGAVQKPGLYPVDPTMTIADAVALAGGATGDGKLNQVELHRGSQRVAVKLDAGTRLGDTPIRSGDQLFVPQRSWVSRNVGLVVGTVTGVVGLLLTLQ
jgi:protein involved in polysaccharide export with SLBB domain